MKNFFHEHILVSFISVYHNHPSLLRMDVKNHTPLLNQENFHLWDNLYISFCVTYGLSMNEGTELTSAY